MTTMTGFRIHALPSELLDDVRAGTYGRPVERVVADGVDPEAVIAEMLSEPGVERIHSRNIAWGCYMFAITRAG
ncbi:MAG: hypothetical protein JWP48_5980 [Actinoallomurus sp.]|jgi:hypothetical protein|nr:hypothetical protein [Actinoallomurus sp.]